MAKYLKFRLFIFFFLLALIASVSVAHACYYTIVCLNVFMRSVCAVIIVLLILVSDEKTFRSRFVSGFLLLFGGLVVFDILERSSEAEFMFSSMPYLFAFLLVFTVSIIIRLRNKFYRNKKQTIFYTGLAVIILLVLVVSNSTLCLGCCPPCHSNLKNLGTALDMYSKDHNGFYPSNLDELAPVYLIAFKNDMFPFLSC